MKKETRVLDLETASNFRSRTPLKILKGGRLLDVSSSLISRREVGGKAFRCIELSRRGLPLPEALVLPVEIYQSQIVAIGLQELISKVLTAPEAEQTPKLLGQIKQRLLNSRVDSQVLELIQTSILQRQSRVAVRSSAVFEDTRLSSAAGLFETTLNCRNLTAAEKAILASWASLWEPEAFGYQIARSKAADSFQMAVLIMQMIDSVASGVLFTCDPVYAEKQTIIEAVWGMGEGLVSKGLTPDRIEYNRAAGEYSLTIASKAVQYRESPVTGQTVAVEVPKDQIDTAVLSPDQITQLIKDTADDDTADAQDYEWTIDDQGQLWYLQARSVTASGISLPAFIPPNSGRWIVVDHFSRPNTRCCSEYYYEPMEAAWNKSAIEIGLPNRVKIREINRFMYYQMGMVESPAEFKRMCEINRDYWETKRYRNALARWDNNVKPQAVVKLKSLQSVECCNLTDEELLAHIRICFQTARQMVGVHHHFTYTAFIVLGDFIHQVCDWTGLDPLAVLNLVQCMAPVRLALLGLDQSTWSATVEEFRSNPILINLLTKAVEEPAKADLFLNELLSTPGAVQKGLRSFIDSCGHRLVDGYDINSETYIERPDLLLKALRALVKAEEKQRGTRSPEEVRSLVPEEKRAVFDELLQDVLTLDRLRQERGLFSDLWAVGILRQAYLEAGSRLEATGAISSAGLILEASVSELKSLFGDDPLVSSEELERREVYRQTFIVSDVPAALGPRETMPDLSGLPSYMIRSLIGLKTAVSLAVDPPESNSDASGLTGIPASLGHAEGPVRLIHTCSQLSEIQRGDILATRQSTAALNGIMPLLGGIVTEYGGILSHQAILAREFGIPCVVGCSGAMQKLLNGQRVHIDGNNGTVHPLPTDNSVRGKLEQLKCHYHGALRGRNRSRALNHLPDVRERQVLLEAIKKNLNALKLLKEHFFGRIPVEQAASQLLKELSTVDPRLRDLSSKELLTGFIRRDLIEFHASDDCNLRCRSCTYFQDDHATRPNPVSYPYHSLVTLMDLIQPKAITIVGGGEPTLYDSEGRSLGDLVSALGSGLFGYAPALGIISNGIIWPTGNTHWHKYVSWFRVSLDYGTDKSYYENKGKDLFGTVVENVFRLLRDTKIPQVGIGFLYNPNNLSDIGALLSLFGEKMLGEYRRYLSRFNIQLRPWRSPVGRPSINEHTITNKDVEDTFRNIQARIAAFPELEEFIRTHTNIAVNLLVRGAREQIEPFPECYFGLAKVVVRADGTLYPCFRVAARSDQSFCAGNIISDAPEKIALRQLYIHTATIPAQCLPEPEKCLFAVFNNILDRGISGNLRADPEVREDYFF